MCRGGAVEKRDNQCGRAEEGLGTKNIMQGQGWHKARGFKKKKKKRAEKSWLKFRIINILSSLEINFNYDETEYETQFIC